VLSDEF